MGIKAIKIVIFWAYKFKKAVAPNTFTIKDLVIGQHS
jgi:hypothetical protein